MRGTFFPVEINSESSCAVMYLLSKVLSGFQNYFYFSFHNKELPCATLKGHGIHFISWRMSSLTWMSSSYLDKVEFVPQCQI